MSEIEELKSQIEWMEQDLQTLKEELKNLLEKQSMDLDSVLVIDIETKGLLDKLKSKGDLHVMSVGWKSNGKWNIKSTNKEEDYEEAIKNL